MRMIPLRSSSSKTYSVQRRRNGRIIIRFVPTRASPPVCHPIIVSAAAAQASALPPPPTPHSPAHPRTRGSRRIHRHPHHRFRVPAIAAAHPLGGPKVSLVGAGSGRPSGAVQASSEPSAALRRGLAGQRSGEDMHSV